MKKATNKTNIPLNQAKQLTKNDLKYIKGGTQRDGKIDLKGTVVLG